MNLADKTAIVTGASSGLGLAVSAMLAARGATVYGLARRKPRLAEARKAVGERFIPVVCDVSSQEDVRRSIEGVLQSAPSMDILINNAGLGRFGPVDELSVEDWDVQMETNLRGVFLCTRAVLPAMKAQNAASGFGGHIVNVASVAGLLGNPNIGAYNASKFGLRGFSESLMKEVRTDGIKVSCIYPGSIETEFFDVAGVPPSANPMTADDVAGTIVHLLEASDNYLISEVVMRPLRPAGT